MDGSNAFEREYKPYATSLGGVIMTAKNI